DQAFARDNRARMQEQHREERSLLRRSERHLGIAVEYLERPQDAEFHSRVVTLLGPLIKRSDAAPLSLLSRAVIAFGEAHGRGSFRQRRQQRPGRLQRRGLDSRTRLRGRRPVQRGRKPAPQPPRARLLRRRPARHPPRPPPPAQLTRQMRRPLLQRAFATYAALACALAASAAAAVGWARTPPPLGRAPSIRIVDVRPLRSPDS